MCVMRQAARRWPALSLRTTWKPSRCCWMLGRTWRRARKGWSFGLLPGLASTLPGLASAPRFLRPDIHRVVLVLPRRIHRACDAGDVFCVRDPLRNGCSILIAVIVAGEDLL